MTYEEFVVSKVAHAESHGFTKNPDDLNPQLKDFQRHLVAWALEKGRAAIFADCGLGKTLMQLVWADSVAAWTGRPVLVLCPLAVAPQTVAEAERFGVVGVQRSDDGDIRSRIVVANYDRADRFDPAEFGGIVLDESSILKSHDGKTRQWLTDSFSRTPFRLCLTATPSPNDHTELGQHAEFLGVMRAQQMLSRWFVHDSMNTSEWRLKGHAAGDFWAWVSSWAVALSKPSDAGDFSDDGYELPSLSWEESRVETQTECASDLFGFALSAPSATELGRVLRSSIHERVSEAARAVASEPTEPFVIWCNLNDESAALAAAIPGAVEVTGSMTTAQKEAAVARFQSGEARVIVSKPGICGFGLNWQFCARHLFVGLSYSYEAVYQAVRRSYRFGQARPVVARLIVSDAETGVLESVRRKEAAHREMAAAMVAATRSHHRKMNVLESHAGEGAYECGDAWKLVNGDCVAGVRRLPDDSVHYSVFSPPFASLYTYTDDPRDMGNVESDDQFMEQFGYLCDELHRVLMPGRLVSMHCMNLPMTKGRDGDIGIRDFRGDLVRTMESRGFVFHSEVCIWKDPLVAMQRTKAIGLLHKQLCKDSSLSRQGIPDYIVTFRKKGNNPEPICHGAGFDRWVGDPSHDPKAKVTEDPRTNKYGHEVWQRYASPVWMDIDQTRVLPYRGGREEKDERHICPLQLDVIERCMELWSNPGDTVLSPFAGIGSEGHVAVKAGRRFIGFELKESYWRQAILNIRQAEADASSAQMDLFAEAAVA